jgi:small subunit ribosomal protein S16
MATVIRLKRGGRKGAPYYRMVVVDSRNRTRGREVDLIGYYHPCGRPEPTAEVNREKAVEWLSRGARPSNTVRDVLSRKGIIVEASAGKAKGASVAAGTEPGIAASEGAATE